MTLTVQDLVTQFDDFADDAKVLLHEHGQLIPILTVNKSAVNGDVILSCDKPKSEDEESEDEESEDEESEDEESEE